MKNEPAFPTEERIVNGCREPNLGMTLLDYFAAHATEEDVKGASYKWLSENKDKSVCERTVARYFHADLMMKARANAGQQS